MDIIRYRKLINCHAFVALALGIVAFALCIVSQTCNADTPRSASSKSQMALAILAVAVAVFQYVFTRNVLKRRILNLVNLDTVNEKVSRYYKLMLTSFYLTALSLMAITAIAFFVDNSMLLCLEALVAVFAVILLKPSAYRLKTDLQLADADIATIYGENWNH